jgi:hypothetical protein
MAILAIHTGKITKEMYENIGKEVNWESNPPPGVIFHTGSFDNSGDICVAEIWESEDQWNKFLDTRLKPTLQKINAPIPNTQIFQIHAINALPGLDKYKVG